MADSGQDLDRVLELLWERAESGNVSAQKALYEHYRREQEPDEEPQDDWSVIYGDGSNVTPLRRSS